MIPELPGNTFGDFVEDSINLVTAIKEANARLKTLRELEHQRCE